MLAITNVVHALNPHFDKLNAGSKWEMIRCLGLLSANKVIAYSISAFKQLDFR